MLRQGRVWDERLLKCAPLLDEFESISFGKGICLRNVAAALNCSDVALGAYLKVFDDIFTVTKAGKTWSTCRIPGSTFK